MPASSHTLGGSSLSILLVVQNPIFLQVFFFACLNSVLVYSPSTATELHWIALIINWGGIVFFSDYQIKGRVLSLDF